uniref:cGMP-dependent protein kinase n=1 Tax=Alexandrium andersonii TaxID=327968 RepID=A0A7S2I1P8_9DINO|mmetsp:Transcript_77812/g.174149  ORF Transcript_77812/g.174149 Transcript_77812/m.174149 type:complete len:471 (+) Transcript_77812:3-1415(+)
MQARVKQKLQEYAKILGSMTCMQNVPEEDKTNLADALVETTYQEGEYVINQGEEGRTFFILYQGEVSVLVDNKEVTRYSADPSTGKFESFGERALEMDEPRAASIKAVTPKVTLLALDRGVYNTVRGMSTLRKSGVKNESMVEYKKSKLTTLGLLGCGGFGVVTLVKCGITGNTFALKALSKGHIAAQNQERSVMNEKGILRMTHSPFLVRLAATFNGDQHLYFLLEPAMGGELFTIYQRKNFYGSEKHARFYVACVLRGFEHLHARQIIYRDLKPENLLLDSKGYCKVTDFGLAKFVIGHTYTTCGTPDYFAPEMVMGAGHTNAVDWWTLGVLVYELMMSDTPFSAQDTIHIFRKVQRGIEAVSFPSKTDWAPLVKSLCKQEPSERLPMRKGGGKAVEEHAWFTKAGFDWKALDKRTMVAPYIPQVKSASDMTNFEANEEDAPPDLHYSNTGACWDKDFEDTTGPAKFE